MKIIVTGGGGFIASHIVDKLIELNNNVVVIDNLSTGKLENINSCSKFYNCDISDKKKLKYIFDLEMPQLVIHHAAQTDVQTSLKLPDLDATSNILGTVNVLECCRLLNVNKILFSSTAAVYGNPCYLPIDEKHPLNPISFYGLSKITCENYIKVYSNIYGLNYTIFRYSNVYGTRQNSKGEGGVVAKFMDSFLNKKEPLIFGDGLQTRDFVYVKDVVTANILAINKGKNETINISSNNPISINELYNIIKESTGIHFDAKYASPRTGDILHSCLYNKNAIDVLDWIPRYDVKAGIIDMINPIII